jgi:hypothetical protein
MRCSALLTAFTNAGLLLTLAARLLRHAFMCVVVQPLTATAGVTAFRTMSRPLADTRYIPSLDLGNVTQFPKSAALRRLLTEGIILRA